jgi:2,5-dihydroxypyridine 5,6-dioxygenase
MRRVPTGGMLGAELVPLFKKHLELCRVEPGQTVLVFSDTLMNPAYPAAVFGACGVIGADVLQIMVPNDPQYVGSPVVSQAWKDADLVIGMTTMPWLYSETHNQALEAGVRTLMVEEPEDILRRLFPTDEVKRRTVAGADLITRGRKLRIASEAGTDLVLEKGDRPAVAQYGFSDVPGRWDHWPGGLVVAGPIEDSANGTFVIDVGDILLQLGRYVSSPITCTLRDGRIVKIEGGLDALILREQFEAAKDDLAYTVAHIGWGTDERARWNEIGLRLWEWGGVMDAESYYGNMQIAFGTNLFRGFGGQTKSRFHFDVPTRNHSFWVDDVQVLDRGRFVANEFA